LIRPRRIASTTASVRVDAPSFIITPLTWNFAVWSLMPRRSAISLFDRPSLSSWTT